MAQQPPGGGGGGGGGDSAYGPVWVIVILFIAGWGAWHYFSKQIVTIIFAITLVQAKIAAIFTDKLDNQIFNMQTADPSSVSWGDLVETVHAVNSFYIYPLTAFMLVACFILYTSDITRKFKKTYDMKKLRQQEAKNWSQIVPVLSSDLINEDISKGPWAMADSPMDFAKRHKLLKKDEFSLDDPQYPGIPLAVTVKRAESKAVFTMQLGPYWQGFDKLPIHSLALCAIFAARSNQDRDSAYELVHAINYSTAQGKIAYPKAKELMAKHMNNKEIVECASKHAYVLTFMASLLELGRKDGVIATADFLWLKTIDRRAWYMLNSVGRQTPYAEVGGAFAHWKAEKSLGRKSMVPLVDEAVKALEAAVKEVKLPIDERRELS